ncbi:mitogen-activated protein kinase kinase kinase 18-like [Lolium perenne]|uniref:mitogen-activated protein kinase kinase kinase 18-like n=1 Tax=Lolium perenne TaxID=4522 RepID=UPI003A994C19
MASPVLPNGESRRDGRLGALWTAHNQPPQPFQSIAALSASLVVAVYKHGRSQEARGVVVSRVLIPAPNSNCVHHCKTRSRAHATDRQPILAAATMAARMGVVEWTRGPTIGRGSSATVSLAVDRLTGELLAVKSVGADRAAELRREQSILRSLSSPYVVRCLGSEVSASDDGSGGYDMLMEYAPGGSLADEIRRHSGRCDETLIRSRARDILLGLAHAHSAGVAHCDVKGRNVLIGADGRAMIADFGCARRVGSGIAGERAMGGGGTPAFMAPEAARGETQGPAVDIWALGCTIIEMATGAAPWQRFASTVATLHHVAFSGEAPELPRWLSEEGKDFLGRCLLQDAGKRWTAEQLLKHEFVAAAAASSYSFVPVIAEKELFVSPKSVLDQALWEEDDDDTTANTATVCPIDRVRALAAGAPDWTWDASWITVHSSGPTVHDDDEPAMSPEADTDGDSPVGGSSSAGRVADAGASNSQASSHADGDRHDDTSSCKCNGERSDDGDHVISSECTAILPITSNGFFSDMLLFVPAGCASLPFPLLLFVLHDENLQISTSEIY